MSYFNENEADSNENNFIENFWEVLSDPEVFDTLTNLGEKKGLDPDEMLMELIENEQDVEILDLIYNGETSELLNDDKTSYTNDYYDY